MTDQTNPREELQDRLMDLALQEVAGGRRPANADFKSEISNLKSEISNPLITPREAPMSRPSRRWILKTLTLAATVLLTLALAYEVGKVRGSRSAYFAPSLTGTQSTSFEDETRAQAQDELRDLGSSRDQLQSPLDADGKNGAGETRVFQDRDHGLDGKPGKPQPSPYHESDDVQYSPAGPKFVLNNGRNKGEHRGGGQSSGGQSGGRQRADRQGPGGRGGNMSGSGGRGGVAGSATPGGGPGGRPVSGGPGGGKASGGAGGMPGGAGGMPGGSQPGKPLVISGGGKPAAMRGGATVPPGTFSDNSEPVPGGDFDALPRGETSRLRALDHLGGTEVEKRIYDRYSRLSDAAPGKKTKLALGDREDKKKGIDSELLGKAIADVSGRLPTDKELEDIKEKIESIEGRGPGEGGDRFREIVENRFLTVLNNPLSTFSIDVDTASYSKVRRFLMQMRQLPPPDAVRIEEFINYFHYSYPGPKAEPGEKASGKPFAVHTDVAPCPWNAKHKLLRVGIKGRVIENKDRPASNLVFLVDVSGSMDSPDKLPLVKRGLKTLVERLRESDRVAIVVYAGNAGLVLDSTPGSEQKKIMDVLDALQPQGSTNGAQGIHLAYEIAQKHHIKDGTNRVILATDGDFNVGTTSDAELVRLVEQKAKSGVFLTALGFGVGNHNDSMLEQIADKGNGNYSYIDTELETRKVFVEQLGGTLVTIAKDVKIQVEFNPGKVAAYRLIGYENRMLRTEDFKDDTKDAGEIGAGHTVTALYELIPSGEPVPADTTSLKYQKPSELTPAAKTPELATVFLRYKDPESNTSKPLEFALKETDTSVGAAAADFKFAAAVASFGMLLRHSQYRGDATFDSVLKLAQSGADDEYGYRKEFIEMVKAAKEISKK
jgi:Ca-activated chloride channel family protein